MQQRILPPRISQALVFALMTWMTMSACHAQQGKPAPVGPSTR